MAQFTPTQLALSDRRIQAVGLEKQYDLEKALEYYNKALDVDASNRDALISVARINELLDDYCYKVGTANVLFTFGKLVLKKEKLVFYSEKGIVTSYNLSAMTDIKVQSGCLQFVYGGNNDHPVAYAGDDLGDWVAVLSNAKKGNYPKITKETIVLQQNYRTYYSKFIKFISMMGMADVIESNRKSYSVILKSFGNSKMSTIKIYKDYKSCDLKEAQEFVEKIPRVIVSNISKDEANTVSRQFEEAGAVVEISEFIPAYYIN